MRYVIIRDDDTNALTPAECLERLYRPFLDRRLPVNLAVIPAVNTAAKQADGRPEGFLPGEGGPARTVPIGSNRGLVDYLLRDPGYRVVQHGCHHDYLEFDRPDRRSVAERLDSGTRQLVEAGFEPPQTFVAPYDRLSRASLVEVAKRFAVLSSGWYELRRLPYSWWPRYLWKKASRAWHWQVGGTLLLSHPGCLLSCQRGFDGMRERIQQLVNTCGLTVLVTHWWEYFRDGKPDEPFIRVLHETAEYLASKSDVRVIAFSDLVRGNLRPGLGRPRSW